MNTKHISITITIMVFASLLLSACAPQQEVEPTVDVASVMAASVQQTVAAMMATQNSVPTVIPAVTATSTPLPLPTTSAPPPVVATSAPASPNCWIADLVSETIPDGTLMRKGETFTKEWRIINGGTCAWNTSYKFVFVDGYAMGAPAEGVPLPESVDRGMQTTVKIKMTAPNDIGTFNGNWVLKSDTGVDVGKFNVKIVTGDKPFAVTRVNFNENIITAPCGVTYNFPVTVTTDGAGVVDYDIWNRINGVESSKIAGKLTFTSSGSQTIQYPLIFSGISLDDFDLQIKISINQPNNQLFVSDPNIFDFICK